MRSSCITQRDSVLSSPTPVSSEIYVACECGAEEQTVDNVVLECPTHRPHGLPGLTVLDDGTIEWVLNTCPEIWCGHAVV